MRFLRKRPELAATWPVADDAWDALQYLADEVAEWTARADAASKRKRGRKVGPRPRVAEWLGLRLMALDKPVTKYAEGVFARTLRVVYEAAELRAPDDLFDDAAKAIDSLCEKFPVFVQYQERHKTRRRKR